MQNQTANPSPPLLAINNLTVSFQPGPAPIQVVRGVTVQVKQGESLGIVGESGCGKSTLLLAIMRLLPTEQTAIQGDIHFQGQALMQLSATQMRQIRGRHLSMIFQDPMTSLTPSLRIGVQLRETLEHHLGLNRQESTERAQALLASVGIADPARGMRRFPHEFSGGMRQRVMIAMALSCTPDLLLADEATTALDVTVQAQVLDIMRTAQKQRKMGMIWVTHDLGVAAGLCDRVAVMYAGQIVEEADTLSLYKNPTHPYTRGLLAAVPRLDRGRKQTLQSIPGQPPNPRDLPTGCPFAPRCPRCQPQCRTSPPARRALSSTHFVRCHLPESE